jgi:hypothetical protein
LPAIARRAGNGSSNAGKGDQFSLAHTSRLFPAEEGANSGWGAEIGLRAELI